MEDVSFKDYINLIGNKVNEAEDSGNYEECIRLTLLLKDVCNDYITKVEKFIK